MARIRSIKPEFWTDSLMVQMPALARLLYIGLWNLADDHGALPDEPDRICMEVLPREDPEEVEAMLDLLISCDRLTRMVGVDGSIYLQIDKWAAHQRVDKPSKSRFPRESSRKVAIPADVRRKVAQKYDCVPGEEKGVVCYACGAPGSIYWHKLRSGKPSGWVSFSGVEIDHFHPEFLGGATEEANLVLTCRRCNRSRGTKSMVEFMSSREPSRALIEGKGSGTGSGGGKEENSETNVSGASLPSTVVPIDARTALFHEGLNILRALVGKPEGPSRQLLGKWLKAAGDDAKLVLTVLQRAADAQPAEPVAWIEGALKPKQAADPNYRGVL